jgi:hypothetical protein
MTKHLSMILSGAACAGLITAAGLSESSAQQMPEVPNQMEPKAQGAGESKGSMPQKPMHDTQKATKPMEQQRTTVERATQAAPGDIRTVTLTVKEVDHATNTITFQAKVSPEANLKKNGVPIKIDQLSAGDTLKIAFDPRTGEVARAEVVRKVAQ